MTRELVVTDDIAGEALHIFRTVQPRTLVLAGGETPRPLYQRLAQEPYGWESLDVFFGDERCVPPDDPASNYRMAFESLLSHVPARVHRMPGETCDAEAYERALREMFDNVIPQFDLAFLGLGPEGHTASLFPGDPALDERERWVAGVSRPDHERMTMTLPLLSSVQVVVFLVAGEEKCDALRRMMAGDDIPANRITAPQVVILADAAAASKVERAA
jgi:6-phosphogluconolactonase